MFCNEVLGELFFNSLDDAGSDAVTKTRQIFKIFNIIVKIPRIQTYVTLELAPSIKVLVTFNSTFIKHQFFKQT
ncbi:CLUMA_CG019174, isoform A [Clunio marinus]|uniref:CLUMA_CG019174, isoform A n=1 Tax=Clunio marinus TaxID=568069 RepID=A0A1J1J1B4_9DIPT|nr:CLUMA_CG019174, isoform A [Clunio marinus]